ncbi:hypothetical protein [Labilithrix luteola]|uniref:hypothetical protein n=1 Tax=Labilithrix luteola TaxID=1391654 RepID=UPI0011BA5A4C|nr:hypothetical protein [Labilithrix luteola]
MITLSSACSLMVDSSGLAGAESSDQNVDRAESGTSNDGGGVTGGDGGNVTDDGGVGDAGPDVVTDAGPGTGDPAFGNAGVVHVSLGTSTTVGSFALQSDGKIIVGGGVMRVDNYDFYLKRLLANGADDTTFNGSGSAFYDFQGNDEWVEDVLIQPDGRIVVTGESWQSGGFDLALVRFMPAGTIDTSFGTSRTNVSQDDLPLRLLRQSDGKILAIGNSGTKSQYQFSGARFTSNGAPDTSFGSGGSFHTLFGTGNCPGRDGLLLTDGTVLVTGAVTQAASDMNFGLARYTSAGALDTTFCSNGLCAYSFGTGEDFVYGIAAQSDGKVLMAGYMTKQGHYHSALVRVGADGSYDTTFGNAGKVTLDVSGNDLVGNVAVFGDWIYLSGYVETGVNASDLYVARLDMSGQLDPSFGISGVATFHLGDGENWPGRMLVQNDGKVVVVGTTGPQNAQSGYVLRVVP